LLNKERTRNLGVCIHFIDCHLIITQLNQ